MLPKELSTATVTCSLMTDMNDASHRQGAENKERTNCVNRDHYLKSRMLCNNHSDSDSDSDSDTDNDCDSQDRQM